MIVRKYGRRGRGLANSYSLTDSLSDVISDSPSQEYSEDVYNFTFSSQEAARCKWSDPYSFSSSQVSKQLKISIPEKGGEDFNEGFRKPKKLKVFDFDSEPYNSNASQDLKKNGVFAVSGGSFKKPNRIKKVASDPYEYHSSEDLDDFSALPPRKSRENSSVFEFSEDGDIWKSNKFKNVDSDSYGLNSSKDLENFSVSPQRKARGNSNVFEFSEDGDVWKPNKFENVESDSYRLNSSLDLEDFSVLPPRKAKTNSSVFEFSEDGEIWKSNKFKNVDSDSYGLNSSQELGELGILQTRKLTCRDFDGVSKKPKKKERKGNGVLQKKMKNKMKLKEPQPGNPVITTTLMETQEFGEMMGHVDEVNFALDGLKKGQPVRTRRGSLLSLLLICRTPQQRRLLRVHGNAKTILDAVLRLNFDDTTSNLAAAALVYILTSDGEDDHVLDSPNCIRFLIQLLKPLSSSSAANEKAATIGSKLLGMCKNTGLSQDSAKGTDSSVAAITSKVQEILVSCKEMKSRDDSGNRIDEPEMNPKWISLLTMEKACLSTISIEDTSGTVRKNGCNFKEKMRTLGGLDAVFEVTRKCHSTMKEWLEKNPTSVLDLNDSLGLESLVMVLKCLKIMENATFLSKDNQCHLLGMKGNFDGQQTLRSFTKLILSLIEILSGVSLNSSPPSKKASGTSDVSSYSGRCSSMECTASKENFEVSQCEYCLKMRVESSTAGSCSGLSGKSDDIIHISSSNSELDDQDHFVFDEDDFEPSKWDLVSRRVKKSISLDSKATASNNNSWKNSQRESSNIESRASQEASCSSSVDEEKCSLLADCVLTAVKVLMNLTNDNPEGCRQIAACGGLEILSSLIASHFPSFNSSLPHYFDAKESNLLSKSSLRIEQQSNTRLTDQQLDFLVAILGLLVNLVEKDGPNRSRLAATSVSVRISEGLDLKDERSVIPLLCSIFLANQGAGEAPGDAKDLSWEDEDCILQGEKEAEKMIVEAYAALLLAFLSTESMSIREAIVDCLPKHNLAILVPVIERFVEFHMTLNVMSPDTHKTVLEVIESCRRP